MLQMLLTLLKQRTAVTAHCVADVSDAGMLAITVLLPEHARRTSGRERAPDERRHRPTQSRLLRIIA